MRIDLYVKKSRQYQECTGEDVIWFEDEKNNRYYWFTRAITSPISYINEGSWITISTNISGYNSDNIPILKNVRLKK